MLAAIYDVLDESTHLRAPTEYNIGAFIDLTNSVKITYYSYMTETFTYLDGITIVAILALFALFLWLKRSFREDVVKPDVMLLNKDIERLNARVTKLEHRADNLTESIGDRIYELKEEMSEIKEILAAIKGEFKAFKRGE